ncbi:MAG: hypothetical protein WC100_15830 [Sterolibacterium sp.]
MSSYKSQQQQYSPKLAYVKWPGDNVKQVHTIAGLVPSWFNHKRLIEPFARLGADALRLGVAECILSDTNPDPIQTRSLARRTPEDFIEGLRPFFWSDATPREIYNPVAAELPAASVPQGRAQTARGQITALLLISINQIRMTVEALQPTDSGLSSQSPLFSY